MGQRRYQNKRRRPAGGSSGAKASDGARRAPPAEPERPKGSWLKRSSRGPSRSTPPGGSRGATAPVLDPALGREVDTTLATDLRAADEELPHTALGGVPAASGRFGRAVDALGIVFALLFVVVTAIIVFEIVMRYAFRTPTTWVHETTSFLTALGFIFGGLYALAKDKHIRVVLLYDRVRGGARRALDVAISVIGLVTVGFFAYAAWTTAQKAWFAPGGAFRLETTGSLFNAPYPALVKGFLLVVVLAMAVQFIVLIVNYARGRGSQAGSRS